METEELTAERLERFSEEEGDSAFRLESEPKTLESSDPRLEHSKSWVEKHAAKLAKDLAETTKEDIRNALEEALETAKSNPDMAFETLFEDVLLAVGDENRAMLIAETEVMNALNHGQRETWLDAQKSGELPPTASRKWVAEPDCCEECGFMDGEEAEIGQQYDNGTYGPPLHPRCRCVEELV